MQQFQINIPKTDNSGRPFDMQTEAFERDIVGIAGGFTSFDAKGAWIDPKTDKLYRDPITVYQIACNNASEFDHIVACAMIHFDDQLSFYTVRNGVVAFEDGPAAKRA